MIGVEHRECDRSLARAREAAGSSDGRGRDQPLGAPHGGSRLGARLLASGRRPHPRNRRHRTDDQHDAEQPAHSAEIF